jgi:tetratricopeptide (TPR) repeat protein
MPLKIKITWIFCILIIFFGFLGSSVKSKMEMSSKMSTKKELAANKEFDRKMQAEKSPPPPPDPIKEIQELNAMGKFPEAVELSRELAKLNPDSAQVFTWWGISLVKADRNSEAMDKFERSAQLNATNTKTFLYWGLALSMDKRLDEAMEKYEAAVTLDPENARAYAYWGSALSQQGKYKEAVDKLDLAIQANKFEPMSYGLLVDMHYHLQQYKQAWKIVKKSRELNISIPEASLQRLANAFPEQTTGVIP